MSATPGPFVTVPVTTGPFYDSSTPTGPIKAPISAVVFPATFGYYKLTVTAPANANAPSTSEYVAPPG